MNRRWLPAVAAAALLAACHDEPTPSISPMGPGGPVYALSVSSSNFQQCANGSTGTDPCFYINGVLNASKSAYHESEVIAERFVIPGLTVGHTYRLVFDYGWEKAVNPGHMNYDFLAGWNVTLGALANPCGDPLGNGSADIRGVCNTDHTIKATHSGANAGVQIIPDAIFTTNAPLGLSTELQAALARFKTVNGSSAVRFDILGGSFPAGAFDNVTYTINGDDVTGRFTVRFVAGQSTVMLLWGGHFADSRDYRAAIWDDDKNPATPEHQDNLTGAAGQSGAPFQFTQQYVKNLNTGDSTGIGSLSNNIQGSVLQAVPKAKITIAASATNGIGEPHTFTVTLQKDLDDGAGYIAAAGEHVDVTLTPSGGATVQLDAAASTCDNAGANTNSSGQCTITFTSNSAGTVTGSASATLTLNGSPVTVSTNGSGDNSGTVVKTFVAGTIRWLKKDGLGQLLGGAVFTVCRTHLWDSDLNGGAGGYTDITDVCFDVTDNVSGTDNTSAPPADRDGTAGEFELGGLILGKYTVQEKTAPSGYILDPDTENADLSTTTSSVTIATAFVNINPNAYITISPLTATNGLNEAHTFTAVATAIPNGGGTVTIAPIAITVSPAPSTPGSVSCQAQSGNTRTCTLTINSSSPGTFTANASVVVTVGTVTLNRDTDPATSDPAGPGGSGPATKIYLGGELTWTKVDGTNGNALLGGATFSVCRTGGSCFSVTDNSAPDLDPAAGKFKLQGLTLGEYTVAETIAPAGYNLDPSSKVVTLTTGSPTAAFATPFVDTKPDAFITIGPNTATNGLNQSHTFTAVATAIPNGGATVTIAAIAITVSPAPSTPGSVSCQAQSGNTRTCTLTINSTTAGTFTANASVVVTVGTVTLNRDTDPATTDGAGPGGSGPATKIYVGGELRWSKVDGDASNALLAGAVFTVCGPTYPSCIDVTDNVAPDANSTGGQFRLENLDVGTYTVEEKTPPAGYNKITGQQSATLTTQAPVATIALPFVNRAPTAFITITPGTATNSTTEAHTFTATMTVDPKGGGTPVIAPIAITVSPAPSTLGSVSCAAQSGNTRTCTLQINSTTAGTFVANASGSVVVGAVTLNRDTDPATTTIAGSGGSGPATKIYVAPTLTITKTAANSAITAGGTTPASYTVVVTNTGQGKAFGVTLSDQLVNATGFSWSVGASSGWGNPGTCAVSGTQLLTCGPVTLNAGASASVTVSSLVPAGYVFVQPQPTQGQTKLEMDGNLKTDGATDWENAGINCAITTGGCALDATGSTDDSFGNGTKEDTPIPSITDGSIPPNKSDLLRFYIANNRQTVSGAVHDFVYLAWERVLDPQGTTNMDFELNQSTTLTTNGVTPERKAGDILIKYDLSNGGGNLSMGYHTWVTSGACEASGAKPPCWGPVQDLTGAFEGKANTAGSVDDPINPGATRTLSTLTFGEASIDMQLAGIFKSGQCLNFGRAYLKSRSSDSFTAAIKDFVKPVPISIGNCQAGTISNTATASALNASSVTSNPPTLITVNP